jgi:hypothetical protein
MPGDVLGDESVFLGFDVPRPRGELTDQLFRDAGDFLGGDIPFDNAPQTTGLISSV